MNPATQHVEEKLLEYTYGELSGTEVKTIEAHLDACSRCADALTSMKRVRQAMAQLPMVPAPSNGLDSLLAYARQTARRASAAPSRRSFLKRWLVPVTSAAALAVVAVVSSKVLQLDNFSTSPRRPSAERETPAQPAFSAPAEQEESRTEDRNAELKMKLAKSLHRPSEPKADDQNGSPRAVLKGESKRDSARDQIVALPVGPAARQRVAAGAEKTLAAPAPTLSGEKDRTPMAAQTKRAREASEPLDSAGGVVHLAEKEKPAAEHDRAKPSEAGGALGGAAGAMSGVSDKKQLDSSPVAYGAEGVRAQTSRSERTPGAAALISQAKEAKNSGDRRREVALLRQALSAAQGSERAQVLRQLCDALDALKQPAEADSACDAVIREFPRSDEAKSATARRLSRISQPAVSPPEPPKPNP